MKSRLILIVEDDELLRESLVARFARAGWTAVGLRGGREALDAAVERRPDVVVLDVGLPGEDGFAVCRKLRSTSHGRHLPILMMTVRGELPDRVAGLNVGADDYVPKPFAPEELEARVEAAWRRSRSRLDANPLTGLPGNPQIEEEATRRLESGSPFVFAYADVDHFKSFNDVRGYQEGDRALRSLGLLLGEAVSEAGSPGDFLGHIGGDDFVLILDPAGADGVLEAAVRRFDQAVPGLYAPEDRERGFVRTVDRRGREQDVPLMSLSVGAVSTASRSIPHYAKLVEIASEMKRFVKGLPGRRGSVFRLDQRKDP